MTESVQAPDPDKSPLDIAAQYFAEQLGLTSEEYLERQVSRLRRSEYPKPECITPDEVLDYSAGGLPTQRREHIQNCSFCGTMIRALPVDPDLLAAYHRKVQESLNSEAPETHSQTVPWLRPVIAAGALAVALILSILPALSSLFVGTPPLVLQDVARNLPHPPSAPQPDANAENPIAPVIIEKKKRQFTPPDGVVARSKTAPMPLMSEPPDIRFENLEEIAKLQALDSVYRWHVGGVSVTTSSDSSQRPHSDSKIIDGSPNHVSEFRYLYRGIPMVQRSYFRQNRLETHVFQGYSHNGQTLYNYLPSKYFKPAFYEWASKPWSSPVKYSWDTRLTAQTAHFGSYYLPATKYLSAMDWLADYLIGHALASSDPTAVEGLQTTLDVNAPISDQIRQEISGEVGRMLAVERVEAERASVSTIPDLHKTRIDTISSDERSHTFVASRSLNARSADGSVCRITNGDVLQIPPGQFANSSSATVIVLSSKGNLSCRPSQQITLQIADLQDMQNEMWAMVDYGLNVLANPQSAEGLPAPPPGASGSPTVAAYLWPSEGVKHNMPSTTKPPTIDPKAVTKVPTSQQPSLMPKRP